VTGSPVSQSVTLTARDPVVGLSSAAIGTAGDSVSGLGEGDGLGVGVGVALGLGLALGVGEGVGEGLADTATEGSGLGGVALHAGASAANTAINAIAAATDPLTSPLRRIAPPSLTHLRIALSDTTGEFLAQA